MWLKLTLILALPAFLAGCYTPIIEGAQQGYDATVRDSLKADAATADPAAEYKLGNNYCCQGGGPMDDLTVYDNVKATHWYCKAARHGYGPAQLQLARIYSGHIVRGLHVALRASALIGNADTDLSVALMWATLAANNKGEGDIDDASELRTEITEKTTNSEQAKAADYMKNWRTAHCQWAEVFPPSTSSEK
jgi:hypothetical protein